MVRPAEDRDRGSRDLGSGRSIYSKQLHVDPASIEKQVRWSVISSIPPDIPRSSPLYRSKMDTATLVLCPRVVQEVVIPNADELRRKKLDLAAVCVFCTSLTCFLLCLWLWTLLSASTKTLRSTFFAIITLSTVLFVVQSSLRIWLYTVADSDTGMTSGAASGLATLICFYFLLPVVSDFIFIPKILAFFPRHVSSVQSRLVAIAFPVIMKGVRLTMVLLIARLTLHNIDRQAELRVAARLTLNFRTTWPLTECVLGIVDESYATAFLIFRMRHEHSKFARSRGFIEVARRFLIASVTTFALPLLFWIGILISIVGSADPKWIGYLYISGTFVMLCGTYFSCILPLLQRERRESRLQGYDRRSAAGGSVASTHNATRTISHPLVQHNILELNAMRGGDQMGLSRLSNKPSSSALGSAGRKGSFPSATDMPLEGASEPGDSNQAVNQWHLPTVSQAGRADVQVPSVLIRDPSAVFSQYATFPPSSQSERDDVSTNTPVPFHPATAPASPRASNKTHTRKISTGYESRSSASSPASPRRRPCTALQLYGKSDDGGDMEAGADPDTLTCKKDVMFAGVSYLPDTAPSSHQQQSSDPPGPVHSVELDGDQQRTIPGRAFRSVDNHTARRNLQTPMSVCDLSAVRIDVETTTMVDYCSGEPLQRWPEQQEHGMRRGS